MGGIRSQVYIDSVDFCLPKSGGLLDLLMGGRLLTIGGDYDSRCAQAGQGPISARTLVRVHSTAPVSSQ